MTRPGRLSRQQAEARGRRAETFAALFLQAKFYTILDRRVRLPVGEIDLIAKRGSVLAFVEVKQRASLEKCQTAVSLQSWRRISNAASAWTSQKPHLANCDWRYDLIAVTPRALPKHFKDFWRP
ncbi:MAG: YraN family protein [Pseudomonadota bacterium]